MHIHVRVHRWVLWWFYVGIVFGVIALVNVFWRDLTWFQERAVFLSGVAFWALGGLVCWAFEGIRVEMPPQRPGKNEAVSWSVQSEWHQASDFLLPGSRKSILPFKH